MGKRGPKPGDGQNTAQVSVKMPDAMKQQLARVVNLRKAAEPSLSLSYGLSEYIREILADHLARLGAGNGNREPDPPSEARKKRGAGPTSRKG